MKPDRLNTMSADADVAMSTTIFIHGLGALVWDYQKQASLTPQSPSPDDPTAQLWLHQRRQNL